MDQILLNNIKNKEVFPVLIKWNNNLYYTGYYYDKNNNDCLFNDFKNIECYKTLDELISFCAQNNLLFNNELAEYDFDIIPTNPIDYRDILNKWNILDTISLNLNLCFEGNKNEYTEVYNYLFSCNFAIDPLPALYEIPKEYFQLINNVFNKQTGILEKIKYCKL